MSDKEVIHETLRSALDADEAGDKVRAVELYSTAVELILKIKDATLREKLNKYAINALERAEELRGITVQPNADIPSPARTDTSRSQGKDNAHPCIFISAFNYALLYIH